MKNWYVWWCAFLVLGFTFCNYFGLGITSTETMPKAPSVKTIRNNPAAFRSFSSSGFTGK